MFTPADGPATRRRLTEVAPGVHVASSAVYATSSAVVEGDAGTCLIVDPGVTAREIADLVAGVGALGLRPVAVWSTHPHWDHLLDGPGLEHLPRWGAAAPPDRTPTLEALRAEAASSDELAAALAARPGDGPPAVVAPPTGFPARDHDDGGPGVLLDWAGPQVVVLPHDGHAPGHSALHLPGPGVLLAGDMLSDTEIPLLDLDAADPVGDYRRALDVLAGTAAEVVVPGHGRVGHDLDARVARDRAYLDSLDSPAASEDGRIRTGGSAPSTSASARSADRPDVSTAALRSPMARWTDGVARRRARLGGRGLHARPRGGPRLVRPTPSPQSPDVRLGCVRRVRRHGRRLPAEPGAPDVRAGPPAPRHPPHR